MRQNGFVNEQGLAIRQARLAKSWTQSVLADSAGISEKTVRRAEAGERIQAETVLALCAVLGLDPANLRSEAEMNPQVDTDRRRSRIRTGLLVAGTSLALFAASVTGVLVARAGGGYKEVADMTLNAPWFNALVLGFGFLNILPSFGPVRRLPGMAALNRRMAPIEPYGLAITFMLVGYAVATLLPFAIADGWTALRTGGEGLTLARGGTAIAMTLIVVVGLSTMISGSDTWNKWAERRLARSAPKTV